MASYPRHPFLLTLLATGTLLCGAGKIQLVQAQTPTPTPTPGLTAYTFGNPSDDETEILAIINRSRANPPTEGQRLVTQTIAIFDPLGTGVPPALQQRYESVISELQTSFSSYPARPPLAFNAELNAAAQFHLGEMIAIDHLTHYSPNGDSPVVRVSKFGYTLLSGENVSGPPIPEANPERIPADSVEYGYETDLDNIDPGYGHRLNLLEPTSLGHVEIGVANQELGGWDVEDLGNGYTPPLLTGAAFADNAGTGFYALGEGVGGVTVTAPGASSFYAVTVASGAYTLPLDLVGSVYVWGIHSYYDPSTAMMVYSPLNPVPTVTVVFTDALGNVTTQAVLLNHTVVPGGPEEYEEMEFYDAAGHVRYDNAEVNLVEPATAGALPTPSPTPTPTPPQVTIVADQASQRFVLSRTGDTSGTLVVTYLTKGLAVAGQDYVPLPGTKTIKAGRTTARIAVYALPGARGTIKLKLVPAANANSTSAPAQAKLRLSGTD